MGLSLVQVNKSVEELKCKLQKKADLINGIVPVTQLPSSSEPITSPWTDITLNDGVTANAARYRTKGNLVELELFILRVNAIGVNIFGYIPIAIIPYGLTDGMLVHGYDISTSQPVMMRIDTNGNGALSIITNTNTDALVFTVQWNLL